MPTTQLGGSLKCSCMRFEMCMVILIVSMPYIWWLVHQDFIYVLLDGQHTSNISITTMKREIVNEIIDRCMYIVEGIPCNLEPEEQ